MKRDKDFYYVFVMFLFVTCFLTCYVLSNRVIQFGGLIATASALVYPFTYFIAVLYYERYGANKTFDLVNFSVISLIFMGILFAFASTFDVYNGADGLQKIFNTDFRILFASVVAFIVGQYTLIKLYDFLGEKKGFDFLIAGVIAITVDSFLFIFLGYIGNVSFGEVLSLATGQYALNVIAVIIYALCFNSIIASLLRSKENEEKVLKNEEKTVTKKRASATKKAAVKKTEPKKASVSKTSTTKKTSTTPKKTSKTSTKTTKKEEK